MCLRRHEEVIGILVGDDVDLVEPLVASEVVLADEARDRLVQRERAGKPLARIVGLRFRLYRRNTTLKRFARVSNKYHEQQKLFRAC